MKRLWPGVCVLLIMLSPLPNAVAQPLVVTLDSPSSRHLLAETLPATDFLLVLMVEYVTPGVILDTVGINAAPVGAWAVRIDADGHAVFQVYAPEVRSPWLADNGWHQVRSRETVRPGQWADITLLVRGADTSFALEAGEPLKLSLDEPLLRGPIWVGDFPGDDHPGEHLPVHSAMTGRVIADLRVGAAAAPTLQPAQGQPDDPSQSRPPAQTAGPITTQQMPGAPPAGAPSTPAAATSQAATEQVQARGDAAAREWVLVDTVVHSTIRPAERTDGTSGERSVFSAEAGRAVYSYTYTEQRAEAVRRGSAFGVEVLPKYLKATYARQAAWTVPPARLRPGEELTITLSLDTAGSGVECDPPGAVGSSADTTASGKLIYSATQSGPDGSAVSLLSTEVGAGHAAGPLPVRIPAGDARLPRLRFRAGFEPGTGLWGSGDSRIHVIDYEYEFRESRPAGANLQVRAERDVHLWAPQNSRETDLAADKQYLLVQVWNVSNETVADDVRVRVSVRLGGQADFTRIGEVLQMGRIQPGRVTNRVITWDLEGRNVEDAELRIETWDEGKEDADPTDNECTLRLSIHYAHNGARPFHWVTDSYGFRNYGYQGYELRELTEGLLATVIGQMYTEPRAAELLQRLLFPQTYTGFLTYLGESLDAGRGGHCYGMSATAALYFLDDALRPVPGDTCDLTREYASANINLYQRAQIVPVAEALISGTRLFSRNWGALNCLETVRRSLRDDRRPTMISLQGTETHQEQVTVDGQTQAREVERQWGHAVLAYKVIDVPGVCSAICVYDPNLPPRRHPRSAISKIYVWPDSDQFGFSGELRPLYAEDRKQARWIAAGGVAREVSLAEANALMPVLNRKLQEMGELLAAGNKLMAVLRCPADVVFTDTHGRRVGHINGAPVNEIPGAEVQAGGEVEIYLLPAGTEYGVEITGTGVGESALDIIKPGAGEALELVTYGDLPTTPGARFTGKLAGGQMAGLDGGGRQYGPTLTGSLNGDRVTVQDGPAGPPGTLQPTQVTPPGTTAAAPGISPPVYCLGIEEGRPVGASDSFGPVSEIWCYHRFVDLPRVQAECVWTRDGGEEIRSQRDVGGGRGGWFGFSIVNRGPGGLTPGTYRTTTTAGGHEVHGQFTIGAAATQGR